MPSEAASIALSSRLRDASRNVRQHLALLKLPHHILRCLSFQQLVSRCYSLQHHILQCLSFGCFKIEFLKHRFVLIVFPINFVVKSKLIKMKSFRLSESEHFNWLVNSQSENMHGAHSLSVILVVAKMDR